MPDKFNDIVFREVDPEAGKSRSNIIKKDKTQFIGKTKISVDEENLSGVKIVLKKDVNDNVREIKFVCSCGQTKSIVLDYTEQ